MDLNNRTSDNKIYSRVKYFNKLPLTAESVHQDGDMVFRKIKTILDKISGSGLLESCKFEKFVTDNGFNLRLSEPTAVNLDGDIFLIANDENIYPLNIPNDFTGSVVLVCWYQEIFVRSTLYSYGGLCNNTLENDLLHPELKIQDTTRYQFRWNLCLSDNTFDYVNPTETNINLKNLTVETGTIDSLNIDNLSVSDKVYKTNSTDQIPSENGSVYLLPLCNINSGVVDAFKPASILEFIPSNQQPYTDTPMIWYNPQDNTFRIYYNGEWKNVGSSSEFSFLGETVLTETISNPSTIYVNIPAESLGSTVNFKILYNGVELPKHAYRVDYENVKLELLNFTIMSGDVVTFLYQTN